MKKGLKICLSIIFLIFTLAPPLAMAFLWQDGQTIETTKDTQISSLPDTIEEPKAEMQTWENPTYKKFEDYFIDFSITAETITEQDLAGRGTVKNPYIVRSTKGYLWLVGGDISGIDLTSKHIELDCDIILNDETFDENGMPSGGDGIVYSWKTIKGSGVYFNGKNHIVKGLFFDDITQSNIGLFGSGKLSLMQNLTIDNVFLRANIFVYGFCHSANKIENCNTRKGYLFAEDRVVSGISYSVYGPAENCKNHFDICGNTRAAGLFARFDGEVMKDCYNYGNIKCLSTSDGGCGGIVSVIYYYKSIAVNFENIINYGDISGKNGIGGLIGFVYTDTTRLELYFKFCKNYGSLHLKNDGCGGFVGTTTGADYNFYHCENYGKFNLTYNSGFFVGCTNGKETEIVINNCTVKGKKSLKFIGNQYGGYCKININGLNVDLDLDSNLTLDGHLFGSYVTTNATFDYNAKNLTYTINCKNFNGYFSTGIEEIHNSIFKVTCTSYKVRDKYFLNDEGKISSNNLFELEAGAKSEKHFYGTDFSGFYVDWKTGRIGLKALSGKGFYQGKVTEEILLAKGYQKKA